MAQQLAQLAKPLDRVPTLLRQRLWELRLLGEAVAEREDALEARQTAVVTAAVARIEAGATTELSVVGPSLEQLAMLGEDLFDEAELESIRKERQELLEMQDHKVARATEIYELIDTSCTRVDGEIRDLQRVVPDFARAAVAGSRKGTSGAFGSEALGTSGPDPGEPTYCFCRRVAFGSMVGCENEQCKYEWFHLDCVGLREEPPEGEEWYCPECRLAR